MRVVRLAAEDDFDGWRGAARALVAGGVPAQDVLWQVGDAPVDLFGGDATPADAVAARDGASSFTVPRDFLALAARAILHRTPERFALLHALLGRVAARPALLRDRADPAVARIVALAQAVSRDIHKMRAFVRFREVDDAGARRYVAWFEPEHHILRANAAFFVDRFANMRWSILTPRGTLHWDGARLAEGPPAERGDAPGDDPVEAVWKTYYAAIFNPARLMPRAMLKEMPRKYWHNLPETALIPSLIAGARARERAMLAAAPSAPAPAGAARPASLALLAREAGSCRRCPLWQPATRTVFGEGPADAEIMVVGEQPGDQEDLAGRPFVGPAGELFDRALVEAGIDRARLYVTNAVKHFKFEPRGRRRLHARPSSGEVEACRWWLDQERALLRPRLVIAMGTTAARALTGRQVTVAAERGRPHARADGSTLWITVHPSHLLRLPDAAAAADAFADYVADLRAAVAGLRGDG